jgi:Caspase domain
MYSYPALSRRLVTTALAAAGLLAFTATAQAPSDVRIALIIGNSAYPGNMALANPSNDAKDMAATLRNMGFGVIEVIDSDRTKMLEAIERAGKNLSGKQGIGMLFYAGHGLQLDWRNYMVPVDAKLNSAADVPKQAVDIETVMKTFQSAGNRMNIVVLDACRDDPFANGKTSSGKGLAPLDAPTGTFLAYATAPGNVAQDGTGKNGLYTGFLLEELKKPSASIENVFKRVRFQVRKASDGAQIPWETTSLEDDFIFNSGIKKVVKLTDEEKEKRFDIEKADWDKIKDSKLADPFYAFVQKYPNGMLTGAAQGAIDRLNAAKTQAFTDKTGQVMSASSAGRFNVGDGAEYLRVDDYTKIEILRRKPKILRVADGQVYFAGGGIITTSSESVIDGGSNHTYDPPRPNAPADGFAVGRKWSSRVGMTLGSGPSAGQKRWVEVEGRVVAFEDLTVPAGTFKAYKLEINQINAWGYRSKLFVWVSPTFGLSLKTVFEGRNVRGGNADRWTEEAISITRGQSS